MRFTLRNILAVYEAPVKLLYSKLRIIGIADEANSLAGIDVVASRRWGMKVTNEETLGTPLTSTTPDTLTVLLCSSKDEWFDLLEERNEAYVRLCDCVNTCDVQGLFGWCTAAAAVIVRV